MAVKWEKIRNEYITADISYRKLSEKYGVSFGSIRDAAKKEQWVKERADYRKSLHEKTIEKAKQANANAEAKRLERIGAITDKLLDKLEKAVDQLDVTLFFNTEKARKTSTDEEGAAISQEVTEQIPVTKKTVISPTGLKQLASSLRDLKEIQLSAAPEEKNESGVVLMPSVLEAEEETDENGVETTG